MQLELSLQIVHSLLAMYCRLAARLTARHKAMLRRWFSVGAAAGLMASLASVVLLITELRSLLRATFPAPREAEAATKLPPTLQLALPGVTLPASHALPLWLALAVSLVVHEVREGGRGRRGGASPRTRVVSVFGGGSMACKALLPACSSTGCLKGTSCAGPAVQLCPQHQVPQPRHTSTYTPSSTP